MIDPIEEQILYKALIAEYKDKALFVSDLTHSSEIGSEATIKINFLLMVANKNAEIN